MTSPTDMPFDPSAVRLRALREALDQEPPQERLPSRPAVPTGPAAPQPGTDELVDRLQRRRSATHVAAAYSAAHGHPLDDDGGPSPRRWALTGPTALAAAGALLLLGLVVVALALWPAPGAGEVEPLGIAVTEPAEDPTTADAAADVTAPANASRRGADDASATGTPSAPTGGNRAGAGEAPAVQDATAAPSLVVHVVGQVGDPGLVRLPLGSRVADAVEAAGGFTADADTAVLNLARAVVDGEQVHVPAPGEEVEVADPAPGPPTSGAGDPGDSEPAVVQLNGADATALATLPGIGPVIADRIVAWRDEHGPFTSIDELSEVSGIGPVLLGELRDLVVV